MLGRKLATNANWFLFINNNFAINISNEAIILLHNLILTQLLKMFWL